MSDASTNLALPYLQGGQAQKHVTVNEALQRLDALVQLSVVSATTSTQPGSPADGSLYILPAGKTGADWGSMANGALAYYRDGVWESITPSEGWIAYVRDTDVLNFYAGAAWSAFAAAQLLTLSATDRILGRVSSGAGSAEEIVFTDQAQQLCDDTSFSAMRTTMGAAASGANTDITGVTLSNTGLAVKDPDASNVLTIKPNSNLTADRTLSIATGDANRAFDISAADVTISSFATTVLDDTTASAARTTLAAAGTGDANTFTDTQLITKNVAGDFFGFRVRNNSNNSAAIAYFTIGNDLGFDRAVFAVPSSASTSWAGASSCNIGTLVAADVGIIRNSALVARFSSSKLAPNTDNAYDLGDASHRFGVLYAGTGTINTSDAREKTAVQPIPASVKRAVRRVLADIGVFQWRDAVARKGEDAARLHIGATAQAVRDAFTAEGEDPTRWALFCADVTPKISEPGETEGEAKGVEPSETRLSLRTDQLALLALATLAENI